MSGRARGDPTGTPRVGAAVPGWCRRWAWHRRGESSGNPLLSGGFPSSCGPEPGCPAIGAGRSWTWTVHFQARPPGRLLPAGATRSARRGSRWWRLAGCSGSCSWLFCPSVRPSWVTGVCRVLVAFTPCCPVAAGGLGGRRAALTPGCSSSRGREGAGGEGNGVHVSPAGVPHLCPRRPRGAGGHADPERLCPSSASSIWCSGISCPFPLEPGISRTHVLVSLSPLSPNFPLAPARGPVCDLRSSEKLLCGVGRGRGGGGGLRGCPGEGMPFSSSLLFLGVLMSKLRG